MSRKFFGAVCALTLAFAFSAKAADSKTQFWFQPKADANALDVSITSYSLTPDKGSSKTTGMPIGFKYLRGLNADMALGVSLNFGTDEYDTGVSGATKWKSTGMSDINFHFAGNSGMGSWNLKYGADAVLLGMKHKQANATKDGDRYSGGMSLAPYAGLEYPVNDWAFGAKLTYTMPFERTVVAQGTTDTESKVTGGSGINLPLYAEYNYGDGVVGASLDLVGSVGETTTKDSAGAETKSKAMTSTAFGLWGSYDFGSEFTGALYVDSITYSQDAGGGVTNKFAYSGFKVLGRYHF